MDRNLRALNEVQKQTWKCPGCMDRGYTYISPKNGILVPCTRCEKGEQVAEQLERKVQDLRTCRLLSREKVAGRVI